MSCFSRNMHFFFLVLTTLMAANPLTSTSPSPTKEHPNPLFIPWHVHVVNGLSNNKILFVHCKSADDDLGKHNLTAGSETHWKFKQSLIFSTLFWCFVASRSDHVHARFNVFWEDWDLYQRCSGQNCIWTAKDDGIYLRNIPKNYDEFMHYWEKDRVLLANSIFA